MALDMMRYVFSVLHEILIIDYKNIVDTSLIEYLVTHQHRAQ